MILTSKWPKEDVAPPKPPVVRPKKPAVSASPSVEVKEDKPVLQQITSTLPSDDPDITKKSKKKKRESPLLQAAIANVESVAANKLLMDFKVQQAGLQQIANQHYLKEQAKSSVNSAQAIAKAVRDGIQLLAAGKDEKDMSELTMLLKLL